MPRIKIPRENIRLFLQECERVTGGFTGRDIADFTRRQGLNRKDVGPRKTNRQPATTLKGDPMLRPPTGRSNSPVLTQEDVRKIRRRRLEGVSVSRLAEEFNVSHATVSEHMRLLAGFAKGTRRGRWVYYSMDNPRLAGMLPARSGRDEVS